MDAHDSLVVKAVAFFVLAGIYLVFLPPQSGSFYELAGFVFWAVSVWLLTSFFIRRRILRKMGRQFFLAPSQTGMLPRQGVSRHCGRYGEKK